METNWSDVAKYQNLTDEECSRLKVETPEIIIDDKELKVTLDWIKKRIKSYSSVYIKNS